SRSSRQAATASDAAWCASRRCASRCCRIFARSSPLAAPPSWACAILRIRGRRGIASTSRISPRPALRSLRSARSMSTQRSETPFTRTAGRPVSRASVVLHGRPERLVDAPARVRALAERSGVELVEDGTPDIAIVLGGDGTTLRALHRYLGTGVPALGVNFGRVGFLTSVDAADLEEGLGRVFAGEYDITPLPTLLGDDGRRALVAVNDIVLTSGILGRMVILEWAVDGISMGEVGCDGV